MRTNSKKLIPGIRPGQSVPFHQLDEYVFQDLCRDLFDQQPSVSVCHVYGTRGQSQYGIDLIAYRVDRDGVEVGQCKCYSGFTTSDITSASADFFKHWSHWSKHNVKRFVLFVACDLNQRQLHDEILEQTRLFGERGITYEPWSAATIQNRLRPHPGIVSTYFANSDSWVKYICGESPPAQSPISGTEQTSVAVSAALVSQVEQLTARVLTETEHQLEQKRKAWQEGRKGEAATWLSNVRADAAVWSILPKGVQAEVLRFGASLELDHRGDMSQAIRLADEARSLAPSEKDMRLQALIAHKKSSAQDAVNLLTGRKDADSLNLKAGILLELGRIEECEAVLETELAHIEPNAETYRIRALVCLMNKDLGQARLEIQKALDLQPKWKSVQIVAAMIDYYSGLSPTLLTDGLLLWPEPVDWDFVKCDDESLDRRGDAARGFRQFAEMSNEPDERQQLQSWYLACLANDPERQEAAIDYCQRLLLADPTHYPAVAWAVARNFGINLKPSEKALEVMVKEGNADVAEIIALVTCFLALGKAKKAIKLLKGTKPKFQNIGAGTLWTLWYAQTLMANGAAKTAVRAIDASGFANDLRQTKAMALKALAGKKGDWQPVENHLETSYEETGNVPYLLELCRLKAHLKKWDYVANRAEQLVGEVGTGEVLRLAAISTFNVKKFDLCLRLLDDHNALFNGKKLPGELRRLRALCQHARGSFPEAVTEAEALAREEPTTENQLSLARLYQAAGNLAGVATVAHQLNSRPELTVEQSLELASYVKLENQHLAKSLWRRAMIQGIPDDLVGGAMGVGFQLGLDEELRPLMSKLPHLAREGRGGIKMASVNDFVSLAKSQRDHLTKLEEAYRSGIAPIHLVAEGMGIPLVRFYHGFLVGNEASPDPLRQPPLLFRHGGRERVSDSSERNKPNWRLHLDVTALLLATHLEVLEQVEKAFGPLQIPASLVPCLIQMRDKVTHHQPTRLQALLQVGRTLEEGSIEPAVCELPSDYSNGQLVEELGEEWVGLFEAARKNNGFVVDFLPLKKRDLTGLASALPTDAWEYVTNCRAVVEVLRHCGPLSQAEYQRALIALGSEGLAADEAAIPKSESLLYCDAGILEALAGANLLRVACERFRVRISPGEADRIRGALKEHERTLELEKWLSDIIIRLQNGISDGTYEIIPARSDDESSPGAKLPKDNPDLDCLLDLFGIKAREGDVVWVDDRCLTGFLHMGSTPIIGIIEVLRGLVGAGTFTNADYFEKLLRLRAANVRFIPLEKEEVLYHLQQARVDVDKVVETRALCILRRYVAACLSQDALLQKPPVPDGASNTGGEIAFVMGFGRTIHEAIVQLWALDEGDEKVTIARAEWLVSNLYVDYLGLLTVTKMLRPEQDPSYLLSVSFAGMISGAIALKVASANGFSTRRRCLDWLHHRILEGRLNADQHLVATVSDVLKKYVLAARERMNVVPAEDVNKFLQDFYQDLPKTIQDELGRDPDFMATIGFRYSVTATIGDLQFDPNEFLPAATAVLNGREARISVVESGVQAEVVFHLLAAEGGQIGFSLSHPTTGKEMVVVGDEWGLLFDSARDRESVLRRNRGWFDCSKEAFEKVIAEITTMENPQQRIEEARTWRDASATEYYETLSTRLNSKAHWPTADLLPPSTAGLLRHFRLSAHLPSQSTFRDALNDATRALIGEECLVDAVVRMASLPVPLPQSVMEAIANLSPGDRRELVRQLLRRCGSPLLRIHLARILVCLGNDSAAYRRLANGILRRFLDKKGVEEIEAFLAVLSWCNDEFDHWLGSAAWARSVRLAMIWAHAHRLFTTLIAMGIPIAGVQRTFRQAKQKIPVEAIDRPKEYWFDIAHPRRVSREALVLAGVSYALGEDPSVFTNQELRDSLAAQVFFEFDGKQHLSLPLLNDPTRATNSLSSFLARDRGEMLSELLGPGKADEIRRESLEAAVEMAVKNLTDANNSTSAWLQLYAILHDLPSYEDTVDQLRAAVRQTDFVAFFEKNIRDGLLVISAASLQVINLDDVDLRRCMKDQLIRIADFLSKQGHDSQDSSVIGNHGSVETANVHLALIESALNVSIACRQSNDVMAEFGDIIARIAEVWTATTPTYRTIVQRLCDELSISQARQLMPTLVRLRAYER